MIVALTIPSTKGAGRGGREVCGERHCVTMLGEDSGCSHCGDSRSHPMQPGAQVQGEHPRVPISAPGTAAGGSEGLWGSGSPLGLCSLAGDPRQCSLGDVISRAGWRAGSTASRSFHFFTGFKADPPGTVNN